MSNAVRKLIFMIPTYSDQELSMPQNVTIELVTDQLIKLYGKMMRDEMFFAVRSRHDPKTNKVNHCIFDVYNYKNYPGAAYVKFEQLAQRYTNELFHILMVAVRFHLVIGIAPDTSRVYSHHKDRPLIVTFNALPKVK